MPCEHGYTCEDKARGGRRCQLCGATLPAGGGGGGGGSGGTTSMSAGALRELEPGTVRPLSELDAVMTLSRVSFDAHRRAPGKAARLDAVNKLVRPPRRKP
eukprot:COSAG06_NODE_25156_length_643_cov_2.391544_1_plen_101_part_00